MYKRQNVMRRQRIYLRNARHCCCKGGANRTTGANQITVCNRLPDQLLRNDIENCKPIADNGIQRCLQPVRNKLRNRISVNFMCFCPADILKLLLRTLNTWRIGSFWKSSQLWICLLYTSTKISGFALPSLVGGVTIIISFTPAIFAGTAFIRTEEGYAAVPPGT